MVEAVWLQNDSFVALSSHVLGICQGKGNTALSICWHWLLGLLLSCRPTHHSGTATCPSSSHVLQTAHEGVENDSTVAPCSFRILHGKEHELKEHSLGFILFLALSDGSHNAVVTFSVLAISLWKTDHNITSFPTPWSEIREYLKLFNTVLGSLHKFDEYHLRRPRIFICRPNKTNLCIWFLYRSSRSTKS